jgi:hypothetical protein
VYRVTVDMRQHCTDGSFRFCRWRAHTEAFSEDSGPEALSTQGQYFALQVFYEILKCIVGKLSANCCRTMTMTRYRKLNEVIETLVTREGYCAECANELLKYVSSLLAREK